MTYCGKVRDGAVVLEPGVELPEGATVRVEIETPAKVQEAVDPLYRMAELAVETDVSDLSTNIDHYLYGHPKVTDAG